MGKLPGIPHQRAVQALERAGFRVMRQGKHVVMTDGVRILTIPRGNPINAFTMGGIIRDAGLTIEVNRPGFSGDSVSPNPTFRQGARHRDHHAQRRS